MASFVKPCSCINFHFLSHRKYRKYDWGPNSFLSRRSQSPLEWSGGRGRGCGWPSEALSGLGRFCRAPKRSSKVLGLQPGVSCSVVVQGRATHLQKTRGSGEHMQLKVVFQSNLPSENKNSQFYPHVLLLFLLYSSGLQRPGV